MLLYDSLKECPVSVIIDDLLAVLVYWNAVRADRSRERLCVARGGFYFLPLVGGGVSSLSGVGDCDSCCGHCCCGALPIAGLCSQGLASLL